MNFKDRFKQTRAKKGISQSELAKMVGVHVTNISRYERGENKPTSEVLSKLADALEVSADYLMSGSTDDMAVDSISDKELLAQFKKITLLSNEDKKVIKKFLDAFLFKNDIQKKLAS